MCAIFLFFIAGSTSRKNKRNPVFQFVARAEKMLLPWTFGSPTLSRETKIPRFSAGWYTSKLYQPFFLSIIFLDHLLPHFHDAMESYSTTLRFMSDFPSRQENDHRKSRESLAFQTSRRTSMHLKKKKKISWKSCLSNESVDFNAFERKATKAINWSESESRN